MREPFIITPGDGGPAYEIWLAESDGRRITRLTARQIDEALRLARLAAGSEPITEQAQQLLDEVRHA